MNRTEYLYEEFIRICKTLNGQLQITPVLYGSLGLGKVAQTDFLPQDIDILVPRVYLEERWDELLEIMGQLGYSLADLREHEFSNGETQIGFAFAEDLKRFADVAYQELETVEESGAAYHVLTAGDYLKVYTKSAQDGYRRTKNNQKDLEKLEYLRGMEETKG